jgi:hypothetical protein
MISDLYSYNRDGQASTQLVRNVKIYRFGIHVKQKELLLESFKESMVGYHMLVFKTTLAAVLSL